jgi:PilZ domain
MPPRPTLLVLDDGELDDLVSLLNELGLEFAHLRGAAIPAQIAPPERVIVTTPRRAMLTKEWPRSAPYRIAVVTEDSNTLRAMLRRVGFDLLLRRPVHPVALRLVILRALYAGEEKRREERVTVGVEIQFRSGFWKKKALLADISQRGCRLLAEQPLAAGTRISVPLPKELSATGLTLPCKVVRIGAKPEADGRYEIGLAYENISKERLLEIRALLKQLSEAAGMEEGRVLGVKASAKATAPAPAAPAKPAPVAAKPALPPPKPAALPGRGAPARVAPPAVIAAPPPPPEERRKMPRAAFGKPIGRLDDEADSVLLGRDLSVGGMRIEYHPSIQVGDVLQLAVYASPREEPVIVKARVAHDAGDGLGLLFEGIPDDVGARLEKIVARLPSVESLQGTEAEGMGSVVSRVLSGFRRED